MINVECKGYKGELRMICRDSCLGDRVTYAVMIDIKDDTSVHITDCELEDIHFISE